MRIAIIEDDLDNAKYLQDLIDKVLQKYQLEVEALQIFPDDETLCETLHRSKEFANENVQAIHIKQGREIHSIPISSIRKITSSNNIVILDTKQGEFRTYETLKRVEEKLGNANFLKLQRGILVNMGEIKEMNGTECTLSDGTIVCMSRRDKAQIRESYHKYQIMQERKV